MPEPLRKLAERLPLAFRVLYGQFLLRVVDLEALSIEADISRFVGQFAGVLILISVFETIGVLYASGRPHMTRALLLGLAMNTEQSFLGGTMLVAGLVAVVTWDNIFPDRRDVMVLGPLPVRPRTILLAKLAAAGALLGTGVLALNFSMGVVLPVVLGRGWGVLRLLASYWFTTVGAALFVYGAVLTVQGLAAMMLPRRWYLRISSILQLAAFALFLSMWLFEPNIGSVAEMARAPALHMAERWPAFWFFSLFNQLSGTFPVQAGDAARRAWVGLVVVMLGTASTLLLSYLHTMKRVAEQPDLVPGRRGMRSLLPLGRGLQRAIVEFSVRSLARSRQHRVIYAFYLAIAFAIAVSTLAGVVTTHRTQQVTAGFLMSTLMMQCLAIAGLRSIVSLPVSLRANWILQVTQLQPSRHYLAATRLAMLVMAAMPVWLLAAGLSLCYRPWHQVTEHLLVLAAAAWIMTEVSMIGVSKIPFACSFLPGKSNVQYVFWAYAAVVTPLAMSFSRYEQTIRDHPGRYTELITALLAVAVVLWLFNRHQAKSAALYYEELEPEIITTLGIGTWQPRKEKVLAEGR